MPSAVSQELTGQWARIQNTEIRVDSLNLAMTLAGHLQENA